MKGLFHRIVLGPLLFLAACTQAPNPGGTEFGNPAPIPSTSISGALTPPQAPQGAILAMASPCGADTAVAFDASGQTVQAAVGEDCKFTLTVTPGKAFGLRFELAGKLVARLVVNSPAPFPLFSFFLPTAVTVIDLGAVQIQADKAIPANSPLNQTDRDGDGATDAADTDDDNDGVLDSDEKDCDLDGFIDDDDPNPSCTPDGAFKPILQVYPLNGQTGVGLNEIVKVHFGCAINPGLFNSTDFVLQKEGDPPILCSLAFNPDFTSVDCAHSANPFEPSSVYQGILQEIECQDGSKTKATTWSWTTAP